MTTYDLWTQLVIELKDHTHSTFTSFDNECIAEPDPFDMDIEDDL